MNPTGGLNSAGAAARRGDTFPVLQQGQCPVSHRAAKLIDSFLQCLDCWWVLLLVGLIA